MVDFLHLECVRCGSLDEVGAAIAKAVTSDGTWELGVDGIGEHTIQLAHRGAWVVVVDIGSGVPTVWADRLSEALRCTAVSMRSWSDEGALEVRRYESGSLAGELSAYRDYPDAVKVSFLANLATRAASRAALTKRQDITHLHWDDALRRIAKLAGLPEPMDRHDELEHALLLGFVRRHAPIDRLPPALDTPAVRAVVRARVQLLEAFHVRATRADLVRAIRDELASHRLRPRSKGSRALVERELFIHQQAGVCSLGEVIHYDDLRRGGTGWVEWGEALSLRLARPVLHADTEVDELVLWAHGEFAARLDLLDDIRGRGIDAAPLSAFLPNPTKRTRIGRVELTDEEARDPMLALRKVARRLGVDTPVLEGELDGVILAFERADAD